MHIVLLSVKRNNLDISIRSHPRALLIFIYLKEPALICAFLYIEVYIFDILQIIYLYYPAYVYFLQIYICDFLLNIIYIIEI